MDLLGSQVNMYIASIPASMPHLQNQRLMALAVTSATRAPSLPNVPTAIELGLSDFEYLGWYGLLAPKGTPKEVVAKLNVLVNQILREQAVLDKLMQEGATPVGGSSDQFAKFIASEVSKWAKVAQYIKDQAS
jgi:tripartite-type tricarboxylate transporter receptor subunit TctC